MINATDPAGNESSAELTVRRGNGKMTVALEASDYTISRRALPQSIRLTATVTDPDGRPLAGADVTFTLSIPGIRTVTLGRQVERQRARLVRDHRSPGARTAARAAPRSWSRATNSGPPQDVHALTIAR